MEIPQGLGRSDNRSAVSNAFVLLKKTQPERVGGVVKCKEFLIVVLLVLNDVFCFFFPCPVPPTSLSLSCFIVLILPLNPLSSPYSSPLFLLPGLPPTFAPQDTLSTFRMPLRVPCGMWETSLLPSTLPSSLTQVGTPLIL